MGAGRAAGPAGRPTGRAGSCGAARPARRDRIFAAFGSSATMPSTVTPQPLVRRAAAGGRRRCGCRGSRSRRRRRPACRPGRRCPSVVREGAQPLAQVRGAGDVRPRDEHDDVGAGEHRHRGAARDDPAAVDEHVGPVLGEHGRQLAPRRAEPGELVRARRARRARRRPSRSAGGARSGRPGRRRGVRPRRARAGPGRGRAGRRGPCGCAT